MNNNETFNNLFKLNEANLSLLAQRLSVPTYSHVNLETSIVHIGVGGFHRAHQAVYLHELAQQGITYKWGELGIGLLPADRTMRDALLPQDCLYSVVEREGDEDRLRVIGSLKKYLLAPDNPVQALAALTNTSTRIVSLTITEGGYNIDNQTGLFNASDADVQADLRQPGTPKTVFGYLCEALDRRRKLGHPPFSIMSCDNLQGNGHVIKTTLTSFALIRDEALANWIESNVAFPNTMVDRITPRTEEADKELVAQKFGVLDNWPVMTEGFRQWVIEDTFCNGRPPLEKVGVQFVSNVEPYELMKLRLLNASHQAMGYLGYLAGYRYISDVMANNDFHEFIKRLMDEEIIPLLPLISGFDLANYKQTLLERFANIKIKDQVTRICTDGSERMPKFLLPSLSQALAESRPHRLLTLAVAGWFRYLRGKDEQDHEIILVDPLVEELRARANTGKNNPKALLNLQEVFGNLGQYENFVEELTTALRKLDTLGAVATVRSYLAFPSSSGSVL